MSLLPFVAGFVAALVTVTALMALLVMTAAQREVVIDKRDASEEALLTKQQLATNDVGIRKLSGLKQGFQHSAATKPTTSERHGDDEHEGHGAATCEWWQSPIIVGGTEGSGTRGAVANVGDQGAFIVGSPTLGQRPACKPNNALDTSCIRPINGFGVRAWAPTTRAVVAQRPFEAAMAPPASLDETCKRTADAKLACRTMEQIPQTMKKPWRWTWKMPHTMWQLPRLRTIFPCAHFVHVLRDPRDLVAKVQDHAYIRVEVQMNTIARALGFQGDSTRDAAVFLCAHDEMRAAGARSVSLCQSYMRELPESGVPKGRCCGLTTNAFQQQMQQSAELKRAMQCATLLSWLGNYFTFRWARATMPQQAYMPYQIELSGEGELAEAQREALRTRTLGIAPSKGGRGRLPSAARSREWRQRMGNSATWQQRMGKWRKQISEERVEELEHCGRWKEAMEEMYEAAVDVASVYHGKSSVSGGRAR